MEVTVRELLYIGLGVQFEKAMNPLIFTEAKIGQLALNSGAHGVHLLDLLLARLLCSSSTRSALNLGLELLDDLECGVLVVHRKPALVRKVLGQPLDVLPQHRQAE